MSRFSIYCGRHGVAVFDSAGVVADIGMTADEQESVALQLLKHSRDRRKNGDHPAPAQESYTPRSTEYHGSNRGIPEDESLKF